MNRRDFIGTLLRSGGLAAAGLSFGCARNPIALTGTTPLPALLPPSAGLSPAKVLNGIDVLVREDFARLKKLRLGLITNHTGHDRRRRATIDLLKNAPGVKLTALFSPEHGIRGEYDSRIDDSVDRQTGLPVYSLYGKRRSPLPEQLRELDALVLDIQDIGCRFYTYPSTMGLCLEAAGQAKLKFFVLDRVNPINGLALEGPLHTGKSSFVAFHSVPLRHGLTVGELARMYNTEKNYRADLTVVPIEGWHRNMWFDQTGLPWTNPSPNMRSVAGTILYPGLGLHETPLSVGRGTDKPFEIVGAPYLDDVRLAYELERAELPGVRFVPILFTPTYSTFKDKPCAGVACIITDRERLNSVDLGLTIALTVQRLHPKDYALQKLNTLLQHTATVEAVRVGRPLAEIKQAWAGGLEEFRERRQPFLIYS